LPAHQDLYDSMPAEFLVDLGSCYQRAWLMPFLVCTEDTGTRSTEKEVIDLLLCIKITHQNVQIV
jgi:hypothetical protein